MTLLKVLLDATKAVKELVQENLDKASDYTGNQNRYGDKTLVLDIKAEEEIIRIIRESGVTFNFLTEEQGYFELSDSPEYLAIIDPIDGSSNLERNIQLCSSGICIVPFSESLTTDDAEISVVASIFSRETFVAVKGKGVTKNGKQVQTSKLKQLKDAIISYDTNQLWNREFTNSSNRVLRAVKDIRRTASNLLDLCWTASGSLEAMVDMRGVLPIVHLSGTHMVFEAGGYVIDNNGNRLCLPIDIDSRMVFIAAADERLATAIYEIFMGKKRK